MIHYQNGVKYQDAQSFARTLNRDYEQFFHGEITADMLHRAFHHFHISNVYWYLGKQKTHFYSVPEVEYLRRMALSDQFLSYLHNLIYDNIIPQNDEDIEEPLDYNGENDMETISQKMIDDLNMESRQTHKIRIEEEQYNKLFLENSDNEGFDFRNGQVSFNPHKEKNIDTHIFDENGQLKVNKMLLPKSGVMSFNLYNIINMKPNKALKHNKDIEGNDLEWYSGENYSRTIKYFIQRSALYIKHLIGNSDVDYLTCPQSSSNFNKIMLNALQNYFPSSQGIVLKPDMLVKNVRGLYVNVNVAKSLGMSNDEIYNLQQRVQKWISDEDLRDVRRKIEALKDEIAQTIQSRKRGRPSKEFMSKYDLLKNYEGQVNLLRQGKRGRDATIDGNGNVKSWQIKSLDDKDRRALEGLFTINPQYNGLQQYLKGKTVIIFDDNISSGATLDDFCVKLQEYGVKHIMAFTLGVIKPTIYSMSARMGNA